MFTDLSGLLKLLAVLGYLLLCFCYASFYLTAYAQCVCVCVCSGWGITVHVCGVWWRWEGGGDSEGSILQEKVESGQAGNFSANPCYISAIATAEKLTCKLAHISPSPVCSFRESSVS